MYTPNIALSLSVDPKITFSPSPSFSHYFPSKASLRCHIREKSHLLATPLSSSHEKKKGKRRSLSSSSSSSSFPLYLLIKLGNTQRGEGEAVDCSHTKEEEKDELWEEVNDGGRKLWRGENGRGKSPFSILIFCGKTNFE